MKSSVKAFFVLLLFFFIGCASSNTETVIKDRNIEIQVPDILDTLTGYVRNTPDSLKKELEKLFDQLPDTSCIEGESTYADTSGRLIQANVKFYPNKKGKGSKKGSMQFELDVKQSPVIARHVDTTKIQLPPKESAWDKFTKYLGLIPILLGAGLVYYIFLRKR